MKLNQSLQSAEMLMWAQTEPRLVQSRGVGGAEGGEDGEGLCQPRRRGSTGRKPAPPRTGGMEGGQSTGRKRKNQEQDAGLLRGLSITITVRA